MFGVIFFAGRWVFLKNVERGTGVCVYTGVRYVQVGNYWLPCIPADVVEDNMAIVV